MIKFPDCLDCEYQDRDEICEECEDGECFEPMTEELHFEEAFDTEGGCRYERDAA